MPIHFFSEGISFKLKNSRKKLNWIKLAAQRERKTVAEINFIFTSDRLLFEINATYLNHHTFTDIITFDYSNEAGISGDIYISLERVEENAEKFDSHFEDELDRVMVHGVLHLCGYKDKNKTQKSLMRKKEDAYLSLR